MTGRRRVDPAKVGGWAREIVARRALILIAVAAVVHVLVLTGALPDSVSEQAEAWTVSVLDALAAVVGIFWIRSGTTPADPALGPRSTSGAPLVEAGVAGNRATGHVRVVADPVPPERSDLEQRITGDTR